MDKLKELLGEELFNQVTAKLGDVKIMVDDGNFVPLSRFNQVNEQKKELQDQLKTRDDQHKQELKERDKQLEDLRSKATGNEELQKRIDGLKKANDDAKTAAEEAAKQWQARLEAQQFDFALERKLVEAKAKNVKATKALLDTAKLKLDGETVLGLEDQLKALRESDPYLFGEDNLTGKKPGEGTERLPGNKKNPWSKEHFNLTEQGRILKDDPELAKRMMAQAT